MKTPAFITKENKFQLSIIIQKVRASEENCDSRMNFEFISNSSVSKP